MYNIELLLLYLLTFLFTVNILDVDEAFVLGVGVIDVVVVVVVVTYVVVTTYFVSF